MKPPSPQKTRKYSLLNGLGRSLGIAFLLFAILPMAVSGVVSYQKAYDNLRQSAEIALKTSALLKTREIQAYFEELLTDLHHQADTDSATRLMAVLIDAQRAAGQSADAFVKSYQWALIDDQYGSDLKKFRTAHMYYDVFLISNQGDILFTVAREEDLGANLFSTPYDRTKFTAAVHRSLSTGQPTFSDYERWKPSNGQLFGFMADVIVNRNGDKIGVIAFQFPIGPINDIMQAQTGLGKTAETYLVGPDFSLRSNSILDPDLPLVTEKIVTYQTRLLKQHWGLGAHVIHNLYHETAIYEGPHGKPVLGIHNGFKIREISFGVIAEIEKEEAFKRAAGLKRDMILTAGLTGLIAFFVSIILVRRIVNPALALASGARRVKDGDLSGKIAVTANNEVGDLAHAFNAMIDSLKAAKDDAERRDWFKNGQMALSTRINGVLDLSTLGRTIITFLANYLDADVGVIYLATEDHRLRRIGSYALSDPNNYSEEFDFGQGLAGQAALEKKRSQLSAIPDKHLSILTGVGEINPVSIVVSPFIYNDEVVGVLELGATLPFSQNALQFLERTSEQIAVSVRTLLAHIQVRELLDQSRVQAEALQNSEAELRVQEEELRQTNAELEEQSQRLEEQKNDIEQKNQELVAARRQIEEKADDFERASRYKSQFLANMSHELRTPLNSILLLSRLLADNRDGSLTKDHVESAATVHLCGNELLTMINDILDLSKIEAGKMALQLDRMNLQSFGDYLLASFRVQTEEKGLTLNVKIQQDLPPDMVTDRQRVEQVIRNFIANALKFTHQGGITLRIRRPTDSEAQKMGLPAHQTVGFYVEDTGIGIPREKQSLIFEAFQQADGTTSRLYGGTGLGLSISRELAKLLGGQIAMDSVPEKGSTFVLYLPEKTAPADPEGASFQGSPEPRKEEAPPVSPAAGKNDTIEEISDDRKTIQPGDRSILLVEDDPVFLKILRDLSREQGFKCLVAESGETSLQLADYYAPSAIILDIGLPGIDGWAVMARLKENRATRHIPVHVISGTDRAVDAMRMGALAFLAKPVSPEDLGGAFQKLKYVISKPVKDLLVVDNDTDSHKIISKIIGNGDVKITFTDSAAGAFKALQSKSFDGMILDLNLPDLPGIKLVEKIRDNDAIGYFPIIVYTGSDLTAKEKARIDQCCATTIVKGRGGHNKLLDETTLFLHRVEAKLPQAQQQIIRMIHDKESLFVNKVVLVVDDDMRNVYSLKKNLEAKSMKVLVGKNGIEALDRLKENPDVALVLMDVMMPEMDGYESMRSIRGQQRFKDLPIIALTAKAMKGDRAKCIEAGASDYLAKPVDMDRLLSMMRVWLYGRD